MPEPSAPVDPKPLAAYRLGLGSRLAWRWNQAFCEMPCGSHAGNVSLALAHLRADRGALAEEMPPDVFEELGRLLDTINERARTFAAKLITEFDDEILDHHARRPPDRPLYVRLAALTDRALANGHGLRPLYDFGSASARYCRRYGGAIPARSSIGTNQSCIAAGWTRGCRNRCPTSARSFGAHGTYRTSWCGRSLTS